MNFWPAAGEVGEESEGGQHHYAEVAVDLLVTCYSLTWGEKEARVEEWVPPATGNPGARDTTTYYTAKGEAEVTENAPNTPRRMGEPTMRDRTPAAQPGARAALSPNCRPENTLTPYGTSRNNN